jgi:hypothetical protein
VDLIKELAERSGVDLPLVEATARAVARAVELGDGDEDMAATRDATRKER